jgi:murein DD-endopeptidase MepM/ murein hydrolase activator NlpD
MKLAIKIILSVVIALIVLAGIAGGYAYYSYEKIDALPSVEGITVAGKEIPPDEATWDILVFHGIESDIAAFFAGKPFEKNLSAVYCYESMDLGELGQEPYVFVLSLPAGDFTATLRRSDVDPSAEAAPAPDIDLSGEPVTLSAGNYQLDAVQSIENENGRGQLTYSCVFSVKAAPPEFVAGRTELKQGEIFSMRLSHFPEGVTPVAETKLGMAVFSSAAKGEWYAAVPIGNAREPGKYEVKVTAGDMSYTETVTVLPYDFQFQDLTVNYGSANVSKATTAFALQQYREKIPPLWTQYDTQRYWEGDFIRPAEGGYVGTEFGAHRITNGNPSTLRYHYGMDIELAEGAPVYAPNNGRIVLAEMLDNTGGTVVIEHGGGLKSYFYHLSRIDVNMDDMVTKGDLVAAVGNTGYSTGPHLHYEMRIGDQAVSPSMLFEDPDTGLYSAERE